MTATRSWWDMLSPAECFVAYYRRFTLLSMASIFLPIAQWSYVATTPRISLQCTLFLPCPHRTGRTPPQRRRRSLPAICFRKSTFIKLTTALCPIAAGWMAEKVSLCFTQVKFIAPLPLSHPLSSGSSHSHSLSLPTHQRRRIDAYWSWKGASCA